MYQPRLSTNVANANHGSKQFARSLCIIKSGLKAEYAGFKPQIYDMMRSPVSELRDSQRGPIRLEEPSIVAGDLAAEVDGMRVAGLSAAERRDRPRLVHHRAHVLRHRSHFARAGRQRGLRLAEHVQHPVVVA